ncbi:fibronectin type III domain-containing protein [Candidatus Fermentibacteria bacterium]|nr:fibronectin type III domain-containing protein [Candidatus Fermentibacteria bacterium]
MRRRFSISPHCTNRRVFAAGAALWLVVASPSARADTPPQLTVLAPSLASPRIVSVGEFSQDVLEDPWDFDTLADATLYYNMGSPSVSNGILTATAATNDPYLFLLHPGYASAQTIGRTGIAYPIDPATYRLLSIRMNVSASSGMYVYWYRGSLGSPGATLHNSTPIWLNPGWAIYHVRLDSVSSNWLTGSGGSNLINGLRIDPTYAAGSTIQIDWIRLSEPGGNATKATIKWIASDDISASVRVHHDANNTGFDGTLIWGPVPATGQVDSIRWSTAHLPHPGGYIYLSVTDGVNPIVRAYSPGPLKVNDVPSVIITDPDELGPYEFAAEVQGNSWDMSGWEDIGAVYNVSNPSFSNGVFWGTSTNDDSQIFAALSHPITTRRYGAALIRQWVDRWTVMRLLWRHTTTSSWHTTDDFVMHPPTGPGSVFGPVWNEYRVADLTELIMEPTSQAWSGSIESIFRLDPNEHATSLFGLDHLLLFTHDMADSSFTLRWDLSDADDLVDLAWYYKTSLTASDSTLITSLDAVTQGQGSFQWDMSGLSGGDYYVSCVANDGLNAVTHNARGVLILNRKPWFSFVHPGEGDQVAPGEDFATDTLGDAWDMGSSEDVDVISGFYSDSTTWNGGVFRSVSDCTDPYLLWLPPSPIVASAHPTLSFSMFLDDPQNRNLNIVVNWYANGQWSWTDNIPASEGWHVYSIDMSAHPNWSGNVTRLRLDPVYLANVIIAIDWVRLPVPNSSTFDIAWEDSDPDDDALIDLIAYQGSWGGSRIPITQGIHENSTVDHFAWDVSFLPAGSYYLLATLDDGINRPDTLYAPYPLTIAHPPTTPVTISGSLAENGTLVLTWSPAEGSVSEYRVYRAPVPYFLPSPSRLIATVPFWQSSYFADLGEAAANPNLNYFFRVTWLSGNTESPPSNTIGEFDFETDPTVSGVPIIPPSNEHDSPT